MGLRNYLHDVTKVDQFLCILNNFFVIQSKKK